GVTVQAITEAMALSRRYPNKDGVVVTGVRPGFPFESAQPGIKEDDVILAVGDKPTPTLDAFRKIVAGIEKKDVAVTFRRSDEQLMTIVKAVPDKPSDEGGELPKAWLGAKTQVLVPDIAQALKLTGTKGFRITEVYLYTEAQKAGLQVGDIITGI